MTENIIEMLEKWPKVNDRSPECQQVNSLSHFQLPSKGAETDDNAPRTITLGHLLFLCEMSIVTRYYDRLWA